jgi:pimeloyl-ACP methyl ester carboxylesterase
METVTSKDGTAIAYDKSGSGRPVILAGGALVSRSAHGALAELLSRDFTVYNYDRRGRGDSGDTRPYSVDREIEDIEALVDAAGGSACLYGISSGACLALETASALGDKIEKLAIYEAPYDDTEGVAEKWEVYRSELNRLLAENRNGEAVELHMKTVGASGKTIAAMKESPEWRDMEALAPTIAYDIAVVGETRAIPARRIVTIEAHMLVIDGGTSSEMMPFMRPTANKIAEIAQHAQRCTLDGQDHNVDEKALAPVVRDFFNG